MKDLDQQLIGARPKDTADNEAFVRRTLKTAQRAHRRETFSRLARKLSVNKQKEHNNMTKLFSVPKFAAVAIGAAAIVGGATYAALNWFGANTESKQQSSSMHVTTTGCSPSLVQALKTKQQQTNTSEYKIVKPQLITKADIEQHELATCEKRAIEDNTRQKFPQIFEAGDSRDGLYYPVGTYGKVVAVNGAQITVAGVPVSHQYGAPEQITTTLSLGAESLLTDKGTSITAATFKPGDQVYFIFQNNVRPNQNDNDWRHTPSATSTVRALAKTQYDIKAITEKMEHAATQGAFQIVNKSDAFGG